MHKWRPNSDCKVNPNRSIAMSWSIFPILFFSFILNPKLFHAVQLSVDNPCVKCEPEQWKVGEDTEIGTPGVSSEAFANLR